MNKYTFGLINDYYPREKMISLKQNNKVTYFYFSKTYQKVFEKAMKADSVFAFFDYDENAVKVLKNVNAYKINEIDRLSIQSPLGLKDIYTPQMSKNISASEINSYEYKMFIDFEFTMPPFVYNKDFKPEILQVGLVISDKDDNIVYEYTDYIKTNDEISIRTFRFLHLDSEDLLDSISQKEFYDTFSNIIRIYNPAIFVWGSSDIIEFI